MKQWEMGSSGKEQFPHEKGSPQLAQIFLDKFH